jgi:hypothetical protein
MKQVRVVSFSGLTKEVKCEGLWESADIQTELGGRGTRSKGAPSVTLRDAS